MHIVVSGVTGVGKTTWAKALVEHVNGKFLGERVESAALFRLANFHPSRRDLRLLAQIRFLMSAADGHADASLSPLPYFQDHSVYEVAEIYTARLAERGDLDDTGLSVLNSLYATIQTELPAPGVVLHLLADPSTIQSRLRGCRGYLRSAITRWSIRSVGAGAADCGQPIRILQ
jgi:deoxyadenosine/deoxycytidine kinase